MKVKLQFKGFACFLFFLIGNQNAFSQQLKNIRWMKVETQFLSGRYLPSQETGTENFYRLPKSLQTKLRPEVWKLSQNSAGIYYTFKSNSKLIVVRYTLLDDHSYSHMSDTGIKGIDLFRKSKEGNYEWVRGDFKFKDTIQYQFKVSSPKSNLEYYLFLPNYASVKNMFIGIENDKYLKPFKTETGKKIVVYGTSITQGACASRPGNSWTSLLSRMTGNEILNYGFSGNGRLELPILQYISKIGADIYILDCLANFKPELEDHLYEKLKKAVKILHANNKGALIILTDHAGYPDGLVNEDRQLKFTRLNQINHKVFIELRKEGYNNLKLLDYSDLNLSANDFVDGTHPTDGGMYKYAQAYYKILKNQE